jgi:hypothetical protein
VTKVKLEADLEHHFFSEQLNLHLVIKEETDRKIAAIRSDLLTYTLIDTFSRMEPIYGIVMEIKEKLFEMDQRIPRREEENRYI